MDKFISPLIDEKRKNRILLIKIFSIVILYFLWTILIWNILPASWFSDEAGYQPTSRAFYWALPIVIISYYIGKKSHKF